MTREGTDTSLRAKGRHDPCVVPRAVPMVEAMVALVMADHLLMVRALGLTIAQITGVKESLKTCVLYSVLTVEAVIALVSADHLLLVRKGSECLT